MMYEFIDLLVSINILLYIGITVEWFWVVRMSHGSGDDIR